jgi:hypothetical protein
LLAADVQVSFVSAKKQKYCLYNENKWLSVFLAIRGFNIQAAEQKNSEVKLEFIWLKTASAVNYSVLYFNTS